MVNMNVAQDCVLENRRTRVAGSFDVIVAGGGPAGVGAAISAARCGLSTLLVESNGFLGGTWTAGLISLMPRTQDESQGGIVREIVDNLKARNAWGGWIDRCFDAETMKIVLERMARENSVELLYHTHCVDAIVEGSAVRGVIVENKSGRSAYLAKVVVDCTGDGDVAAHAGARFELGRASDGLTQPLTLIFKLSNVDFWQTQKDELLEMMREASRQTGIPFEMNFSHPYILMVPGHRKAVCQMVHVRRRNAVDARDLTEAEIEGRRLVDDAVRFFKEAVPALKDVELEQSGPRIGVRETRRVVGEYYLQKEDLINGAQFPDGVVNCFNAMDIHEPDGYDMVFTAVKPYQIPYRCLVPKGVDNLLVAGRCISGSHEALAAYRMTAICTAMGQVAGNAAGLAVRNAVRVREIDTAQLVRILSEQGVLTSSTKAPDAVPACPC